MKVCSKCNLEKNLGEFYFRKDTEKYRNDCKECFNLKVKSNRIKNPSYMKDYLKEWRENNPNANSINSKRWRENNPNSNSKYVKERKRVDNLFRIKYSARSVINTAFRYSGFKKNSRTHIILGCDYEYFLRHIESNFESWMTWENKGLYNGELNYGWDIDHIMPVSSGKTEDDMIKLNHYTNLQPLCSKINRDIKKNKIAT